MPKSVLITGGAGFIGFHAAKKFSKQYDVTLADNFARGKEDYDFVKLLENKRVSFIKMDITNKDHLSKLDSHDFVCHFAAINGTQNFYNIPDQVVKVGAVGTINMLDWACQTKTKKFVFSSSSEVYAGTMKLLKQNFPIPTPEEIPLAIEDTSNVRWSYGASKLLGEIAINAYSKKFGLTYSIIRYHNIYGPRMGYGHVIPQFIERILANQDPFKIFGGEETRAFCFVDDAVNATKLVMENKKADNLTINIGRSDEEIKIIDLAKKLFLIAKVSPKLQVLDAPAGSVKRRCPKITRLVSLGGRPKIRLNQGLRKTFAWYKKQIQKKTV